MGNVNSLNGAADYLQKMLLTPHGERELKP